MYKVNHAELIETGMATRFGPGWPGTKCLAKTRRGTLCQNPVVSNRCRCRMHGGMSRGPTTPQGKEKVRKANWKHGQRSRAHVERVKAINAELRRVTYELRRDGLIP